MRIRYFFNRLKQNFTRKRLLVALGCLVAVFVLVNLLTYLLFREKAYPNTRIADISVGGKAFSDISSNLGTTPLLPDTIEVSSSEKTEAVKAADLGVSVSTQNTFSNLKEERSILPFFDLFRSHEVKLSLEVENAKLSREAERLSAGFSKTPKNASITLKEGIFDLEPSSDGFEISPQQVSSHLLQALSEGRGSLDLNGKKLDPKIKTSDLQSSYNSLRDQQNTSITYTYADRSTVVSARDIGSWYRPKDNTYELSEDRIRAYIQDQGADWGVSVDNLNSAVSETVAALKNSKKISFRLTGQKIIKTFTYCTSLKDVGSAYLADFIDKLAAVYGSSKGWSLGGQVAFKRVSSGCQFTVWLAAADQMPSFGAICDSMWSCRVGRNVVINFDRWRFASSSWNGAGGSLNDYRTMVINHETGHWLGFGHLHCSGAGKLAPVMQQQSIDLEGCKFNPWPTTSELSSLRARLF